MSSGYPKRVVCLTEETTEVLYRIGAGDLVVGVSGFTVRPPEAREKPKISRFLDADTAEIEALRAEIEEIKAEMLPYLRFNDTPWWKRLF